MRIVLLFVLSFSLNSCDWIDRLNDDRIPVARVKEAFLYTEDIHELMPELESKEDSLNFIKNFSEKWVEEQILLDRAAYNLNEDLVDIDAKVRSYRNSLLIYAYEQALVGEKLDTNFTQMQVANYYNQHTEDFVLKQSIYNMVFLKLDQSTPRLNELREWFNYTDKKEKLSLLTDYALQFGLDYSLDDQKWWRMEELIRRLPLSADSLVLLSEKQKLIEFNKAGYLYLFEVSDFLEGGQAAPLAMVESEIKKIVLNKRKVQLVKELRKDLISDAASKNHIEYFQPNE